MSLGTTRDQEQRDIPGAGTDATVYQKQTWKVTYIINYWPLEASTQPLRKACVVNIN